jgi:S1-C subfamily serine protease
MHHPRLLQLKTLQAIIFAILLIPTFVAAEEPVPVHVKAALVEADMSIRPVPRHRLEVLREGDAEAPAQELTTSLAGEARIMLAPGHYRIRSVTPLRVDNVLMTWDVLFEATGKETVEVELSNDNARQEKANPNGVLPPSGAASVFKELHDAVVTLESESGHGTAFLVDHRGLLLTNEHVISGSRYFTAAFDDNHRLAAKLVTSDATEDVAVLAVNLESMPDLPIARLAADSPEQPAVQEGDAVFAVGSPLHQQKIITAGIVSKVEAGVLISDVMIDHGNSGGPLINANHDVVGINTFGEGRGVSGTVRIWKALPVVEAARSKLATFDMPSAALRPAIPSARYPADEIKRLILTEDFDIENYHLTTHRFDVYVLTPPALCFREHQSEIVMAKGRQQRRKRSAAGDTFDPAEDVKGWAQYVGEYQDLVQIIIEPRLKPTAGSSFAAGMLGTSSVLHYRYQGDVDTVRLLRGKQEVVPIRLGRSPVGQQFASAAGHMEDIAYAGYAEFLADAFQPGTGADSEMKIEIVNEAKDGEVITVSISSAVIQKVWNDFAPMRNKHQ